MRRTLRQIFGWCGTETGATVLVLLAVVLSLGGTWWYLDRSERQRAGAFASLIAASVAHDLARGLDQLDLSLQTMTGGRQSPTDRTLSEAERNSLLSERTPHDRYIDFVDVLDVNGYVQATTRQLRDPTNWANRDYFYQQKNNLTDGVYVGRPFDQSREGFLKFPISRRVTDDAGRFAGVVVAGLRLSYLRDLIVSLDTGPDVSVTILREDGVVLMRVPFEARAIGSSEDAAPALAAFLRSGVTPATVAGSGGAERQVVFRRAGSLPLVVSVSTAGASHRPGAWLLAPAVVILGGLALVARWLWRATRQRAAAERESREKSRFLTTLSHELRTPLHGILGYAETLARQATLAPEQLQQVSEIIRAGKHMRDVVNVVLDYARIEARGPAVRMRRINVRDVVEECLALVEPAAKARGLETRISVAPDSPPCFVTDEIHLRQILTNLLHNAVKYTPRGKVELRVTGDAQHLVFEVIDTGIGIPEGQRHQLFKEYERFGAERTGIEGTGLGLAIASRLIRRLGGNLGHRNNPGGGSVFWLELPAGAADGPEIAIVPEDIGRNEHLNVLVVDDSEVNRAVAAAYLRAAGHVVTETDDAREAVRIAAARDFDVVLMDMRMAGMDGLEATRRIRALSGSRGQVPIVAVTANALDQHAEECRAAGMSEHLAKPFTQAELIAVVTRAVARRPSGACDLEVIAQLDGCTGDVQRLLDCLALRIEALLRKLDDPMPGASNEELAELAHELVGSAGTLGFSRLASAASRFERLSLVATARPDELYQEAVGALAELRRLRSRETVPSL